MGSTRRTSAHSMVFLWPRGGSEFTLADIVAYETFGYATAVCEVIYQWDLMGAVPGLVKSREAVGSRPSVKAIDAARNKAMAAMQDEKTKQASNA